MGDRYQLHDNGGNAMAGLFIRLVKTVFIGTVFALFVFFINHRFTFTLFLISELVVVAVSLFIFLRKREAEEIIFEKDQLVIKGRRFIFFKFTYISEYAKVRYRFRKIDKKKKKGLFAKPNKLILFRKKRKWVEFTPDLSGWPRGTLADITKDLIAHGCYNWFDFSKKR